MSVRVRFAPSPTGALHIGGARTALFNWLYARHCGGVFVLRIEDTDEARNTPEAIQIILDSLKWLGLDWDEGPLSSDPDGPGLGEHGPYFQSRRDHIYRKYIHRLLDAKMAYAKDGAIRFRMDRNPVTIHDRIVGEVERKLTDREALDPDFVIVRSDGRPVFHLVNVIDDIEMGITHVIRGEDHLTNTARHIRLYDAFGVKPPEFAHIPLILNPNGSKMSKSEEGASMNEYMDGGFLPEAVNNFLSLLGWSPGNDDEILPVDEIVRRYDLDGIHRSNARFDMNKLVWMNGEYIHKADAATLVRGCLPFLEADQPGASSYPEEYIAKALEVCREKVKTFAEMPQFARFFFMKRISFSEEETGGQLTPAVLPVIKAVHDGLEKAPDFSVETVAATLSQVAADLGVKPGKVMSPARLAITGQKAGPGVHELIHILGREQVLTNLRDALDWIQSGQ